MTSRGGTMNRHKSMLEGIIFWQLPFRIQALCLRPKAPKSLEPRLRPFAWDAQGSREGEGDGTFLQSSHTTQAEPSIPSCSPHRMQRFTPSPATFFLMFSRRSTRRLEAESGLYRPYRTRTTSISLNIWLMALNLFLGHIFLSI